MDQQCFALITGATSGIGEALCNLLAKKGINLIAVARDEGRLQQLKTKLESKVNVVTVSADLSSCEGRGKVIALLHEYAPTYVVNNAGFGLYGDCLTYSTKEQLNVLEVNGVSVLELTLEAARSLFSKGKKGAILNISSVAAFHVYPSLAVYSASKAFVSQFSQSFDEEMREHGIRILTCCPGMVETKFSKRAGGTSSSENGQNKMTPEFVACEIWNQLQTEKPLRIINRKYALITRLSNLLPQSWVTASLRKHILQRIEPRNLIKIENESGKN